MVSNIIIQNKEKNILKKKNIARLVQIGLEVVKKEKEEKTL